MNLGDFRNLLELHLTDNNEQRAQAESAYITLLQQDSSQVVCLHVENLFQPGPVKLKCLGLIHLCHIYRKMAKVNGLMLSQQCNEYLMSNLLNFFRIPEFTTQEMSIVEFTVALLGAYYISRNFNIELPNQLLALCHDLESPLFQSYMTCLSQIIKRIPTSQLVLDTDGSLQLVTNCLTSDFPPIYSSSAMKILFALVEKVGPIDSLRALAPNVCTAISNFTGDLLFQALSDLNIFANKYPHYFSETFQSIIEVLLAISSNAELPEYCRSKAIANMTILIHRMPELCQDILGGIIEGYINIGCEVTEEDFNILDEDITICGYALYQLGGIICNTDLGLLAISICNEAISQLLSTDVWENIYTGLIVLEKVISAGPDSTLTNLGNYLSLILPHMTSDNPIIRTAACDTLSKAASIYQPQIQNDYYSEILPVYINLISNDDNERSCGAAISSLGEYCSYCSPQVLQEYCNQIVEVIVPPGQQGDSVIQGHVIGCINVLLSKLKSPFADNYHQILNTLMSSLQNQYDPRTSDVRARVLELVKLRSECVAPEVLAQDLADMMNVFLQWDWNILDSDEYSQLLSCISAFARIIPAEFLNYTTDVLTKLIEIANTPIMPVVHQEFQSEFNESNDTIPYFIDNSVIEVSKSEVSKRVNTILTIDSILSVLGMEECCQNFWGSIKKVLGACLLAHVYPTLPENALSCFQRFFTLYAQVGSPDYSQLAKFGAKFIHLSLKLAHLTPNISHLPAVVKYLRYATVKLATYNVFSNMDLLEQVLNIDNLADARCAEMQVIPPDRELLDTEIGEFITMWLRLYPQNAVEIVSNLKDVYPLVSENVRPLTLHVWVLFFTFTQCSDEKLHSDLIREVFNSACNDSIVATLNAFLCLSRLASFTALNDETLREAFAIIASRLESPSISNFKEVVDAAMIANAAMLPSEYLSKDIYDEFIKIFIDKMPIMTKFDETEGAYNFFMEMIESGHISIDIPIITKLIQIVVALFQQDIVSQAMYQRICAIFTANAGNEQFVAIVRELIQQSDLKTQRVFSILNL